MRRTKEKNFLEMGFDKKLVMFKFHFILISSAITANSITVHLSHLTQYYQALTINAI